MIPLLNFLMVRAADAPVIKPAAELGTPLLLTIAAAGGPEQLVPETRAVPVPSQGQVLIRVAYAGVNRPDVLQRMGAYAPPPGASDLPGLEAAGEVVGLGAGVTRWKPGDRVCALLRATRPEVALCDAHGVEPDAVTVDALARLQLAASRTGCRVVLRHASDDLLELVAFMGLADVLGDDQDAP